MKKILCFLLLIGTSCLNTLTGHRGVSNDLNESKKRKVFVKELRAPINPYIVNDTLKINVLSAWLENEWYYDTNPDETILSEHYQLIIESDESVNRVDVSWQIGNSFKESFRPCGKESIMIDLDSLPNGNKFEWNVTLGRKYDSSRIIGKFELFPR
jgi:hypothetical protein